MEILSEDCIDFRDVFGGPPRRSSSIHESRPRVFGDGGGSGGRRQLGDDFYKDIFQSGDSACSSPRRGDRDSLQSSQGSRINSPNRSLSEKMDKGLNHPAFGFQSQHSAYRNEDDRSDAFSFPLSPNASSTGLFTTQSVVGRGDVRNNGHPSYRQSPLSHQISSSFEGLLDTKEPSFQTVESLSGKSSSSLEDYISNQQFHFSIYKWAGKGVMLVMPSDSNERNEYEGRFTAIPEIIIQEVNRPSKCDYFSHVTKASKSGTVTQENTSDKKEDDYIETAAKGLSHTESGLELLKDHTNKTADKCGNQSEKASIPCFDSNEKHNPEFKFNAQGEQNHELKSLSQLFEDDIGKWRSGDVPRQVKERDAQTKSQKKQQLHKESRLVSGEGSCTTLHDTPSFSEDKRRGNKVKGKVKEFIRKFNQEGSPKRKGAFEMLARRSKGEENRQNKVDELVPVSIRTDKSQGKSGNNNIPLFDFSKDNQVIEKAEEDKSGLFCDDHPSDERIEVLPSQSESTPEALDNAACHEENILEDFERYLVQQLPTDLTEAAQNSPQQDQIENLDAKIRQWSRGKEGNIRSLLSTLQLVLWAESGWKQIPLVNIIEGAAVKKAYQRALLCLHPDKLQQKAASSSQKYIAEKVFDILQEAWDHFSSLTQF